MLFCFLVKCLTCLTLNSVCKLPILNKLGNELMVFCFLLFRSNLVLA